MNGLDDKHRHGDLKEDAVYAEHASQDGELDRGHVDAAHYTARGARKTETGALLPPAFIQNMSQEEIAAMAKKLRWKLDLLIMPIIVCLYILNYLDRQNIAAARLAGISTDLKLTTVQYQTCVSVLFAGYIGFQIPSNMIIGKIRYPAIYICICTALWGMVSALTAAVHNFEGLVVCRLFLGIVEAAFFPGAMYYLTLFYNRKQLALRLAILYSGSQLGSAFGNLLAIGILNLSGKHGLAGWRWLFIIEGVLTIGLALIFACILPNRPATTHWLKPEQREYLVYTLELDQAEKDTTDTTTVLQGLFMAVTDPKTWLFMSILFFDFIGAAVTNFFPSVVQTLGYSRNITYLLTAPPYILCCIVIIINALHSDKVQERFLHIFCPLVMTIVANILAVSTIKTAPRYVAMMLMPCSYYAASTVTVSWIATATNGPAIKRSIVLALINSFVNSPNIWTSYLYINPPRYLLAFCVNLGSSVLALGACTATYLYLRRANGRMAQGFSVGRQGPTEEQRQNHYRFPL